MKEKLGGGILTAAKQNNIFIDTPQRRINEFVSFANLGVAVHNQAVSISRLNVTSAPNINQINQLDYGHATGNLSDQPTALALSTS